MRLCIIEKQFLDVSIDWLDNGNPRWKRNLNWKLIYNEAKTKVGNND